MEKVLRLDWPLRCLTWLWRTGSEGVSGEGSERGEARSWRESTYDSLTTKLEQNMDDEILWLREV